MQHQTMAHPASLVCVAAPADQALLSQWETHLLPLQQAGLLTFWSERQMQAGADRKEELIRHLNQADVVVLLLSADFFADDTCQALMHDALQYQSANRTRLIPLLVRPVMWQESALGTLAALPANGVAITTWDSSDEGWRQAVLGLERLLGLPVHQRSLPARARATPDRERMLHRLRRTYQALLEGTLQGIALMELGLAEYPDAVRNATHLLQRLPDRTERVLPTGTSVLSVYDQAEEELLILGAPGAGKSTLLLDLAQRLIERAEANETHPLPVIVPLSSWATTRTRIADWLVEQLARIYDVPRRLAQAWIEQGQVLPLLDGLDEMEKDARPLCIAAVNAYHAEHLTPLVVCSRRAEYDLAACQERLLLQNAVVVQPLTNAQVAAVIGACGPELAGLHAAFIESPSVRDLATTPLMLSVLILAYRGTTMSDLPQQEAALEERVWTNYVERMARQKGADRKGRSDLPEKRYSLAQTSSQLSWLAQQMRKHNQTLFYGESLQESWLPTAQQLAARWVLVRLPVMFLGVLSSLLLSFFFVATADPVLLCQIGLLGGFLGWCLSQEQQGKAVTAFSLRSWQERSYQKDLSRLLRAVLLGFLAAVSYGLYLGSQYHMSNWLQDGVLTGICLSLSIWLLQGKLVRTRSSPNSSSVRPAHGWSRLFGWIQTRAGHRAVWAGIILGTGVGVSLGMSTGLSFGLRAGLSFGLRNWLSFGLSFGGATFLVSMILETQTGAVRLAERIHWSGRPFVQWTHLRTSLIIALACFCCFGLIFGLGMGLDGGLTYNDQGFGLIGRPSYGIAMGWGNSGLIISLTSGLSYGLGTGLSSGFCYWLLLGLYQGVRQEHLEEQDRRQFNQGLHRSLYNGALLSLLSAGIITASAIGLINELSYVVSSMVTIIIQSGGLTDVVSALLSDGPTYVANTMLNNGLMSNVPPDGLSIELRVGWLLLLCGWLVVWAATGGLTLLRHYLVRLLLASSRTFPWRARHFLDDATARVLLQRVGGGYGFVHRRLLDYFATGASSRDEAPVGK